MPIYEYQCQACGHRMDHLQKLSDPDPVDCPACGAAQLKRRVSAPSFRLSGSGWYETDFKGDKEKKRNLAGEGSDAKPGAAADSPGSAGGESKPASSSGDAKPAATTPAPAAGSAAAS